eukprot:347126-Lingulodinium_polyedra.AAC.1
MPRGGADACAIDAAANRYCCTVSEPGLTHLVCDLSTGAWQRSRSQLTELHKTKSSSTNNCSCKQT